MKFSIVTPTYNMAPYIGETIESVLSQKGNFEIEYIVMDGGSTDGTIEILKKYEKLLRDGAWHTGCNTISFSWFSQKDEGMYDAINKGFIKATGDVYAWLNADDLYVPGAFQAVADILSVFPEIEWLKGTNSNVEADGKFIKHNPLRIYHREWLQKGIYGKVAYFIEQDTVFWKNSLWKKIGGIPIQYKYAGDYFLWTQFAKHARLWSFNKEVSIFRKRKEQLSQRMPSYQREQDTIIQSKNFLFFAVRVFFNVEKRWKKNGNNFFDALYRILFTQKNESYVDIEKNRYIKKGTRSFRAC